jgi:hypothetical protein
LFPFLRKQQINKNQKNLKKNIMKKQINTFKSLAIGIAFISNFSAIAQTGIAPKPSNSKDKISIKISTNGVEMSKGDKDILGDAQKTKKGKRNTSSLALDFGFCNFTKDVNYIEAQGINITNLKTAKSLNFNITQFYGLSLYKKNIYVITGLGMNINNYRYISNLQFAPPGIGIFIFNDYEPKAVATTVNMKKNKIATNYLTVPLMLQFKLGEGKKKFVLGGGMSAGYLIKGWQKVVYSGSRDKENISYVFNPFALNAIGEIGIDNRIRFYGSYSLTPIHKMPIQQNAFTFGLRFGGI